MILSSKLAMNSLKVLKQKNGVCGIPYAYWLAPAVFKLFIYIGLFVYKLNIFSYQVRLWTSVLYICIEYLHRMILNTIRIELNT